MNTKITKAQNNASSSIGNPPLPFPLGRDFVVLAARLLDYYCDYCYDGETEESRMDHKIGGRIERHNPPAAAAAAADLAEPTTGSSSSSHADVFETSAGTPAPAPRLDPKELSRLLNTLGTDAESRAMVSELLSGDAWKADQLKTL